MDGWLELTRRDRHYDTADVLQVTAEDHSRRMGLLDNLFKPKPDSGGEKSVENSGAEERSEAHAAPAAHGASPKISPFLAPKIYVPRSSVQIVPPARNHGQGDRKLAPVSEMPHAPKEIVLTLGDVYSRIPAHFLQKEKPDLHRELKFPADGLAADIARGRASVALSEIVAQCPDVFVSPADGIDGFRIRLPLQKLVEQISLSPEVKAAATATPVVAASPVIAPPVQPPPQTRTEPESTGDLQIHLSLAAILKRCPQEIIVRPLPPIADSVRVTFPFAPIERQLAAGQVEVSSLRFIAALPLELMKCFEAKAGVKVPLPLEEIFQNLPNQAPARSSIFSPHDAAPAAVADASRENARLAEAILLEPMFEPVRSAEADVATTLVAAAVLEENNVVSANFAPPPAPAPVLETVESRSFTAEKIAPWNVREVRGEVASGELPDAAAATVSALVQESHKADASLDLAAELEALAAEDAKLESQDAEISMIEEKAPIPDETPAAPPEPESPAPPVEEPSFVPPEPIASAAFRPFVPALRPPVILQSTADTGESLPASFTSAEPDPPVFSAPPEASDPVEDSEPEPAATTRFAMPSLSNALERPPAAPEPEPTPDEPVVEIHTAAPAPFLENPPPPAVEAANPAVHISPPQFRPFVVLPPPIVLAPSESVAGAPLPAFEHPEPAAAPAPPEPEARIEPPVESPIEPEPAEPSPSREMDPAPAPEVSPTSDAPSPMCLDGRLREFFASDGPLPIARVSQLLAALPGIQGALLMTRAAESHSGELPAGLDPATIRDLSRRMRGALADHAGDVQHLTLHSENYSLSLFTRGEACVCAIHRTRIFLPGVRERFSAAAEELAQALNT